MTPEELLVAATDFVNYYINGSTAPRAAEEFPKSSYEGIVLRRPARVDIRPEYTPLPHPEDGATLDAGVDGPEGVGPYLFLDRCPLRKGIVSVVNGQLIVELVFVTVYPPQRFADEHPSGLDSPTNTGPVATAVRLPSDVFHDIAAECLSRLEDYLGTDASEGQSFGPFLGYRATLMSLEDFDAKHG